MKEFIIGFIITFTVLAVTDAKLSNKKKIKEKENNA